MRVPCCVKNGPKVEFPRRCFSAPFIITVKVRVPLLIKPQLRSDNLWFSNFCCNAYKDTLIALFQNLSSAICGSIMHGLIVTALLWPTSLEVQKLDGCCTWLPGWISSALVCTGHGQFYFSSPPSLVSFKSIRSAILIFCRTFSLDPFYGLFDLPLLLLEVAGMWSPHYQWEVTLTWHITLGIGYYIPFIAISMPSEPTEFPDVDQLPDLFVGITKILGNQPPTKNCQVVYLALAIFLFLEALLQMGSLILYLSQHHVLLHHRALTAEDSLKPYQIMFGRSTSVIFLKQVNL